MTKGRPSNSRSCEITPIRNSIFTRAFAYRICRQLKTCMPAKRGQEIPRYSPPDFVFKFYMDCHVQYLNFTKKKLNEGHWHVCTTIVVERIFSVICNAEALQFASVTLTSSTPCYVHNNHHNNDPSNSLATMKCAYQPPSNRPKNVLKFGDADETDSVCNATANAAIPATAGLLVW